MNDKTAELIESLAAKLGTTAEYLWGVLLKQAYVSVTTNLILIAVLVVVIIMYLKWLFGKLKDEEFDWFYNGGTEVFAIVGGFICFILGIFAMLSIPDIITGFLNPEYWALQQILEKL